MKTVVQFVSSAQLGFEDAAATQVQRLLGIHSALGGGGRGRRRNLEILNKSAVVLTCAFWEAFVEDLVAEVLEHLAEHARSPGDLPIDLRKNVAKSVLKSKHELAPWDLANDGWRDLLRNTAKRLSREDDQTLSSPSSRKVDEFFQQQTGIEGLAGSWKWSGVGSAKAQGRLDQFVKLRNAIAHRGGPVAASIKKGEAEAGLRLIRHLTTCSLHYANLRVAGLVGVKLIPDAIPIELPDR